MFRTETFKGSKLALAFAALALVAAAMVGVAASPAKAEAVTLPYTESAEIYGTDWYYDTPWCQPGEAGWYDQEGWKDFYTNRNGASKLYSITVSQASKVSIALTNRHMYYDSSVTIAGVEAPQVFVVKKASTGGVNTDGTWTSVSSWVVESDNATTVSLKKGSYAIFVYAGRYADDANTVRSFDYTYDIAIKNVTPNATSVTLKTTSKTMTVKGTYVLLKSKTPTISKGITWTSSNKNIATVDSTGKVTAKNLGKCTVKAKCANGKVKSCTIIVNKKNAGAILKGSTKSLRTSAKYATGYKTGKWSSSNKSIATVTSKGTVKGVKAGSCKIYLKTKARTYTFTVTVKDKVSGKVVGLVKDGTTNYCCLTLTNNTAKKVTYVEATISEYNSKGSLITKMKCKYNESPILAHSTATDLSVAVNSNAKTCKIKVTYAKFSDGTSWTNK